MRRQTLKGRVRVTDEALAIFAASMGHRRIPPIERADQHRIDRRRDEHYSIGHRNQPAEGVDILCARRVTDVSEDGMCRADRPLVDDDDLPAMCPVRQCYVDAERTQYTTVSVQPSPQTVRITPNRGPGELQEITVRRESRDPPASTPQVEHDVLQSRLAHDGLRKPSEQHLRHGSHGNVVLLAMAEELGEQRRFSGAGAAREFDDHRAATISSGCSAGSRTAGAEDTAWR